MSNKYHMTALEKRVEEWFEPRMIVVTLFLVVTLAVPFLFTLPDLWVGVFATLNLLIWCTFYVELFVKVYVAKSKKEAIKRNWTLLVITLAPLFLPLRLMRVSRLLVFIRFLRLQKTVSHLRKGIREFIYNIEYILITFVVFIVTSAFIMWQIETKYDGSILSLADALWWAVITATTIGYGDVIPASNEGKILGAIVSLCGAILFMVFVARVTTLFVHDKEVMALRREIKAQNRKLKGR